MLNNSYVEGVAPTQKDMSVFKAISPPTAAHPHAQRWYEHIKSFSAAKIASLPGAAETLAAATKELSVSDAPKAAKEDKAPKEKKEKAPAPAPAPMDDEPPKEKKEEHPLKILDKEKPSPFIGDAWKKLYSNTPNFDDCFKQFWEGEDAATRFDPEGYSIYFCRRARRRCSRGVARPVHHATSAVEPCPFSSVPRVEQVQAQLGELEVLHDLQPDRRLRAALG